MIQLDGTNEKIRATPGTTGTIDGHAVWADLLDGADTVQPGSAEPSLTTGGTPVDIVASPAASTSRRIKFLGFRNRSTTVTSTVMVEKIVAAAVTELHKVTLLPGWELVYNGATWFTYDSNGAVVTGPTAGRFLRSTLLTAGTTFTTGVDTDTIRIRVQGGGGGGGGCTSVASAAAFAGGGGGGAYAEKVFDVLPNTNYTYAIGTAGAGASGAAGTNGGSSTFTVGGTTVTAPGGTGGAQAVAANALKAFAGGVGATTASNGDVNQAGPPGHHGCTLIVTGPVGFSGSGADSVFGAGGIGLVSAVGNGNAASGFGGGGGGSATGASTVRTGGNATAGCIIVEEYT